MFATLFVVAFVACTGGKGGKSGENGGSDSTATEDSTEIVQKVTLKVLVGSSGSWYKTFKPAADTVQVEGTLKGDKMRVAVSVPVTCRKTKPEQATVTAVEDNPALSITSRNDDKLFDKVPLPEDQKAAVLDFLRTAKVGDTKEFTWKTEMPACDFEKFKLSGNYYLTILSPITK